MTIDTSSTDPLLFDIVALADEHRPKWRDLYRQYAHFYAVDITDAVLDRTWSWLIADAHELHGYVARDQHNRPLVRWITSSDNAPARGLYDQIAEATHWVTYDMRLGGVQDSD